MNQTHDVQHDIHHFSSSGAVGHDALPCRGNESQIASAISLLMDNGYRLTRPFVPRECYADASSSATLAKAAILDTETTGTSHDRDKIVELGVVVFEYDRATGQAHRVLTTFNELEDPGFPIPPEATRVHGITDQMVMGRRIDDHAVAELLRDVSIVIAHNAKFDRPFVENRFPFLADKHWGCSLAEVDWLREGFGSSKLEFLAYRHGFHYEAHRASSDCHALLELLQQELPSGGKVMASLLENARAKNVIVWATGAPIEYKEALKHNGYRWNGERKIWFKGIPSDRVNSEAAWLKDAAYAGRCFMIEVEHVTARERFSKRRGFVEQASF